MICSYIYVIFFMKIWSLFLVGQNIQKLCEFGRTWSLFFMCFAFVFLIKSSLSNRQVSWHGEVSYIPASSLSFVMGVTYPNCTLYNKIFPILLASILMSWRLFLNLGIWSAFKQFFQILFSYHDWCFSS